MGALVVRDVRFGWGNAALFDGLSLTVRAGEVVALLGANGAGKSTLLQLVSGLAKPRAGSVQVMSGTNPGYVPQDAMLWGRLGAREQLVLTGRLHDLPRREAERRADVWLERVSLADHAGKRADALSGGMRRRLSVAMALMHGPRLLLLDEPDAGLDVEGRAILRGVIREVADGGCAVLMATHAVEELALAADRVVVLAEGRVAVDSGGQGVSAWLGTSRVVEVDATGDDPSALRERLRASAEALGATSVPAEPGVLRFVTDDAWRLVDGIRAVLAAEGNAAPRRLVVRPPGPEALLVRSGLRARMSDDGAIAGTGGAPSTEVRP